MLQNDSKEPFETQGETAPLTEAQTQDAIVQQIERAEQRISDLQYMQATGQLEGKHYHIADAAIRAYRKLIMRLYINKSIRRYSA